MTFTSIASKSTHDLTAFQTAKLAKISITASFLAIVGVTVCQNLLWMPISSPAELPTRLQATAVTTVK